MNLKPKNGHVLVRECTDPAPLTTKSGLELANVGFTGQTIGEVVAIDEDGPPDRPHVCKVGDIVYFRDPEVTGQAKVDEGQCLLAVRECLIWAADSSVKAVPLPSGLPSKKQYDTIVDAQRVRQVAKSLALPKKKLEIIQ